MSCDSFSGIATEIWNEWGEVLKGIAAGVGATQGLPPDQIYAMATEYEAAVKKTISRWNDIAGNSWAKLGPRKLQLGDAEEGTVVHPGERTFLTPGPLATDCVELAIKSRDGKAECEVMVCAHGKSGRPRKLWTAKFASGSGNDGDTKKQRLQGIRGMVLSVNLKPRGLLKSFAYQVKLTKAASRELAETRGDRS